MQRKWWKHTVAKLGVSVVLAPLVPLMLIVMLGALSVAGLIGSAIVRFGRLNWSGRDVIVDRRVNWESARTHHPSLSEDAMAAGSMRELGISPGIARG